MESAHFEENLFADSDFENEVVEGFKRKRKLEAGEKDFNFPEKNNNEDVPKLAAYKESKIQLKVKHSVDNHLWSIDDTLFYPFGITTTTSNIVGVNKSVLLIWSDLSLINFVIKKNLKTNQTKTTKVRIYVPNGEQIKDIKVLEKNTLLLLESGRMNYFSSSKSMHKLTWLDKVRCIAQCPNGFSIIRLTSEFKLLLEVYGDVVDMGKMTTGPLKYKYDITFDEQNLFKCGWEDEHYHLLSTVINENNLNFLQLLTRQTYNLNHQKITRESHLHFFTISGNVFLLVADIDTTAYNIEMLFSYSSNVTVIKLDFERNFCFIFLECGMIDIWHMASKKQYLCHQTYTIGVEHISFSYSESRAALYFTDGNQVGEFRFACSTEGDELILHETYKAIPGILACTWIEAIDQLVCLDCNNIFHQLSFEITRQPSEDQPENRKIQPVIKTAEFEKFNALYELTPQRVEKLLEKAHLIQQLNELPRRLYDDIEQQFRKQELLAVCSKRRHYKTLLKARLQLNGRTLSCFQNDVTLLYTQNHFTLDQSSFVALIYVDIEQNEIFEKAFWQLHLQFESSNHIFTLSKSKLSKRLCLVVPLEMGADKLLPKFSLHLYAFLSCAHRYVAISLPVAVECYAETFDQLYTFNKYSCFKSLCSEHNLEHLLRCFIKQPQGFGATELKCYLSAQKNLKLNSIFKITDSDSPPYDENTLHLNFMGFKISVCYDPVKNVVILCSDNAITLFCTKMHLQLSLACQRPSDSLHNKNLQDTSEKILRFQCHAEQLYGTLVDIDSDEVSEKTQMIQKLKLLKEFYFKMRRELFQSLYPYSK